MHVVYCLQNRYYEMILSTKLAGLGHAAFCSCQLPATELATYTQMSWHWCWITSIGIFTADTMNLSDGGYHMWVWETSFFFQVPRVDTLVWFFMWCKIGFITIHLTCLRGSWFIYVRRKAGILLRHGVLFRYIPEIDWLARPGRNVPRQPVPPLKVSIPRKVKEVVEAKYKNAGAEKGKYIVIHGIQCDSKASMQSKGDPDSLLPIQVWAEIAEAVTYRYCSVDHFSPLIDYRNDHNKFLGTKKLLYCLFDSKRIHFAD